jgi:alpha-galactosidase
VVAPLGLLWDFCPGPKASGRTHDLAFRAGTALFGHLGIEWDVTRARESERAELARWVALHKQLRGLLHTGSVVRVDHPDPTLWAHGVVSHDRTEAVFALTAVTTPVTAHPGTLRLPGLDPALDADTVRTALEHATK